MKTKDKDPGYRSKYRITSAPLKGWGWSRNGDVTCLKFKKRLKNEAFGDSMRLRHAGLVCFLLHWNLFQVVFRMHPVCSENNQDADTVTWLIIITHIHIQRCFLQICQWRRCCLYSQSPLCWLCHFPFPFLFPFLLSVLLSRLLINWICHWAAQNRTQLIHFLLLCCYYLVVLFSLEWSHTS